MATTEASDAQECLPFHDILRRIESQRAQRYTDAGPDMSPFGAVRFRHEGSRLIVAYARFVTGATNDAVDHVIAYARNAGSRIVWNVTNTTEATLPTALITRGFALDERLTLMARQGELRARLNPTVTISPITTWSTMWAYEHGSRRSFYDDSTPDTAIVTARASERWRQQQMGWYRYYAASLDGQLVGGAYVSMWEDVPTLMGVYTLENARKHGVATSTLAQVISDLVAAGKDTYCLYVKEGNPARRLYEELGFHAIGVEETYILAS